MRIELLLYLTGLTVLLWVGIVNVIGLSQQVVGKTPEGFHRADAAELMQALCDMNRDLTCPDAYALPHYLKMTEGAE